MEKIFLSRIKYLTLPYIVVRLRGISFADFLTPKVRTSEVPYLKLVLKLNSSLLLFYYHLSYYFIDNQR